MRPLSAAFEEALGAIPNLALEKLLVEKLEAQGVSFSPPEVTRLRKGILEGRLGAFIVVRWPWWRKQDIVLEFTEDDLGELEQMCDRVAREMPQILGNVAGEAAASVLESLKRRWAKEWQHQQRVRRGFERRLRQNWGTALDRLWMFLTISREFGSDVNRELRASKQTLHKTEVLTRLHARACQVANEVLVLLEAGFADGAMARWRSLHEIAAVAIFVQNRSEVLAERYILHQHIESRRAARNYAACQDRLGYEPLDPQQVARLDGLHHELVGRFGAAYGNPYGWAAEELGKKDPKFCDIERAAGIDHLHAHYQMASHGVHANPKGVFFKLGLLKESDLLLAGPSDAGLSDPGHSTAISLLQVSSAVGTVTPTLDNIVTLRVMLLLADEIGEAFAKAHNLLVAPAT